jgi:trigger factor
VSTQERESEAPFTANGDYLSVTVTKKPRCQVKFDIKVDSQAVEAAYLKTLKNVNKEVTIPGFRKGRAPEPLILERYQPVVERELLELVLKTGFNEAIQLTHLHPLKNGNIQRPIVHECSQKKGAHFTIEFEARPIIPSVKFEDLQIQKVTPQPITEQDRQNALQNLLLQFATYDPIEGRPVQENDFVNLSMTILEDPPHEMIRNQRSQVNPTGLPAWLRQKIIGLQIGESVEGMTEQDPQLIEPDPNFKSLPFRVTIHAIWQGHLPAVDEALAKRVGLQSVEELHKKIDERLEQQLQEEALKSEIRALELLLVEKYPIDLPQSYIDANKKIRLDDYLKQSGKDDFSKKNGKAFEELIEQSTIFYLQLYLLLRRVASDHNITIDNQEISQELNRQLSLISSGRHTVDFSNREEMRGQLYNTALERKVKQFLIDHITQS